MALALALCVLATGAQADNLGSIGPVYPIAEESFLAFIARRLEEKQRLGEIARLQREAQARAEQAIRNPAPVAGLRATDVARTFYFDPTFVLPQNVIDPQGRVLFTAGTRKNPLEVVSLSKHLLFFDARDKRQVERASALIDHYAGKVKPILVGGSYLELMESWKRPVYYDQHGSLTRQLGIRQVPALVSQEGMRLRIDEIRL